MILALDTVKPEVVIVDLTDHHRLEVTCALHDKSSKARGPLLQPEADR